MKLKNLSFLLFFSLIFLNYACSPKKSDDVAPIEIAERLEISPTTKSILIGENTTFTLTFFDKMGNKIQTPSAGIVWSSSNNNVASISQSGIATGITSGQVTIKAIYNNKTEVTALLTIVANNNQVATITLEPNYEILLNGNVTLQAVVKNNLGQILTGKTITWASDNTNLVNVNTAGMANALMYGTANITAMVEGIQSNATMVQVVRTGNFSNNSTGIAKLKIENGVLKLSTSSNFVASGNAPDLRIYLAPNTNNINGALEIATLNQRNGMQTWNIANNVSITQYRYVLVWCKQFGGVYGLADLGM
jgi:hypothetical protein